MLGLYFPFSKLGYGLVDIHLYQVSILHPHPPTTPHFGLHHAIHITPPILPHTSTSSFLPPSAGAVINIVPTLRLHAPIPAVRPHIDCTYTRTPTFFISYYFSSQKAVCLHHVHYHYHHTLSQISLHTVYLSFPKPTPTPPLSTRTLSSELAFTYLYRTYRTTVPK